MLSDKIGALADTKPAAPKFVEVARVATLIKNFHIFFHICFKDNFATQEIESKGIRKTPEIPCHRKLHSYINNN